MKNNGGLESSIFATTALVAFAGAASAQEITLRGFAEMGMFDAGNTFAGAPNAPQNTRVTGSEAGFFTDIDVTFTFSSQTDNGLTFGASVDLDEVTGAATSVTNNADDGGATISLGGAFGTVTMGDTDGAYDWAMLEVPTGGGSLADDETSHGGWELPGLDGGHDGQIVRYDYSVGDFGIAVSAELADSPLPTRGPILGIGFTYGLDFAGGEATFALAYQAGEGINFGRLGQTAAASATNPVADTFAVRGDVEATGVSAIVALENGLSAGLTYSQWDLSSLVATTTVNGVPTSAAVPAFEITHTGIGIAYTFDAISVGANWGEFDVNVAGADVSGFGLSAEYDLGGGVTLNAGYGATNVETGLDTSTWSAGVRMSF